MKSARLLLIIPGLLAALVALAVGIAMLPSVQRWAVLRAVEGQPGLEVGLDRISAGPTRFKAAGVSVRQDGITAAIGHVEGRYSLWDFLVHRRVAIASLRATDVVVDARSLGASSTAAGAVAGPAAAPGVLAQAELPYEIVLGEADIRGRALLPGSEGKPAFPAEFTLTGGGIAPGREGTLQLTSVIRDESAGARVRALRANMSVHVSQTMQRTFDRAAITLVVDAEGPQFADQNQLRVNAEMSRSGSAEKYTASIDTLLGSDTDHLLTVEASLPAGANELAGQWSLQARDAQLAPFFLGGALPQFAAEGAGKFSVRPDTGGVTVAGRLRGEARGLEVAAPELRAVGPVTLETEFDIARDGHVLRVQRLRARLDGERPVLAVETSRPMAVDYSSWQFDVGAPAGNEAIARLNLSGLPLAWVRPFVAAADVSGGVVTGEFGITARDTGMEVASLAPFRVAQLTVVREGSAVIDRADITAQIHARFAAGAVHTRVRGLDLHTVGGDQLSGELEAEIPLTPAGRTGARGNLTISKTTAAGSLAALGAALRLQVSGDVTIGDDRLEVKAFSAELRDRERDRLLLSAQSAAWSLDLNTFGLAGAATGAELGRITLGAWPMSMLSPLVEGGELSGELTGGTLVLSAADNHLQLQAPDPVRIANFGLKQAGDVVVDRVSFELAPAVQYTGLASWKVVLPQFQLRAAGGARLANLAAEVSATDADGVRGSATFDVDLPAMATQPLLASAQHLSAGRASGELRAAAGATVQVEARATLNGLVAKDATLKLPVANLSFRGVREPSGRVTIEAPLLFDRLGQRSEIRLAAEGRQSGEVFDFTGRLTGERVDLPDVLGVLALFGAPVEAVGAPEVARASRSPGRKPDEKPFWHGVAGELALDIKSLTNGPDWSVAGLAGSLQVQPTRLVLSDVAATINQRSRFNATAGANFAGGMSPYRVAAEFALTEFDLGAFLKSFDPERPPVVEGMFTVAGKFTGSGATFEHALDQARGEFQLNGGKGIFRGLKRASERVSVASKAVELGAALGSLLGSSRVREAAEKVAGQSYQVDQLAQALGEFPFDQLVVRTTRDESLDVKIEELSLISPEVRLVGSGVATYQEGVPVLDQRLNLTYAISARGKVEKLLEKLKVLDGNKDELGYATTKEKGVIVGTLSKPDASSYFIKLAESKFTDFLEER